MDWEEDRNGMIGGETVKRSLLTVFGSPTTEKVESDGGHTEREVGSGVNNKLLHINSLSKNYGSLHGKVVI